MNAAAGVRVPYKLRRTAAALAEAVSPKDAEMRTWPALELRFAPELQDLLQAALVDFNVTAIDEGSLAANPDWRVFFHDPESRDAAADVLRQSFPADTLAIAPVDVPDDDWAARSQAGLNAIRVGNIVVAPPWDAGNPELLGAGPAVTIVIEPSMGFGTGHHATTRLCLAALQAIDLRGKTLIDVGTGSGVLALAASRLGAVHVLGIDDDPDAIESARQNVGLNPGADVTLGVVDIRRAMLRPFDVVVANLTGGLLMSISKTLSALTAASGQLILGGFLEREEQDVRTTFADWRIERRLQEDEWVCVTLSRISHL
jgi:ribosomal protein L11 methyltransferase